MEKKPNIASAYIVPPDEVIERRGGARPNAGRKKKNGKAVTYRFPEEVIEIVQRNAKARGVSMSEYVAEAVEAYNKGVVE